MNDECEAGVADLARIYGDHVCDFSAWFTSSTTRRGPYCAHCLAEAPWCRVTKVPA